MGSELLVQFYRRLRVNELVHLSDLERPVGLFGNPKSKHILVLVNVSLEFGFCIS